MASKQRQPSAKNAKSGNPAERGVKRSAKRAGQHGGTFLGVVLGLIVGLAIAVVVALYITRAPTPFVSRSTPASDAGANSASNGNTDPNRPLAGATPGQAVPQSAQPSPPNTAPGQPANPSTGLLDEPKIVEVPASSPNNATNAPATSPSNASTQGQWPNGHPAPSTSGSAPAKSGPATPSTSAPSSSDNANTGYFLQAGAYRTEADADQQRGNLAMLGFSATVTRRDSGAVTFFRVRLGPYAKFDDMNAARQNLSSKGVDTAVIRFTRQ